MTTDGKLLQAEADLAKLINRVKSALPAMQRAADDAHPGWNKEVNSELLANLREAVENAEGNQRERREL